MQAVAAWLVARPLNAILALAATISLAWFSFLSGVVLVLLVLHKDFRAVAIDVVGAAVLMIVVGVIAAVIAIGIWVQAQFDALQAELGA